MPIPAAAAAIGGAVKAKTAKEMAAFAKSMQKTDWDGVNSAMTQIRQFGESASSVQETLGDINEKAQALIDIGLSTMLTQLATAMDAVFVSLLPAAEAINNLVLSLDKMGISVFKLDDRVSNATNGLDENALDIWKILDDWGQAWGKFLGIISPTSKTSDPDMSGLPGKINELEGGF